MGYYVSFDGQGRAVQSGCCMDGMEDEQCPSAVTTVLTASMLEIGAVYFNGVDIVQIPPAPTAAHVWDWGLYAWFVDDAALFALKAARAIEVNAIRDERQYLPVLYDGVLFDTDPQSRTAMTGLEARIRRGDGLTAPWRGWRTYDNSFVWAAATAEQVLQHLPNLQRLLEDRWQGLLNASWALKDALAQLETADDVLAFDVQAGWPG